ncbi:MAG: helix-turn-helix domain-containing protein [Dehalococcoidia bacterium]|nr:helix-turn-helix domain-containing protein [Dehalococcoidia bacterium]
MTPDPIHRLLTPDEAARQLRISRSLVYLMARRGELPCVPIRSAVRFRQETLNQWLIEHETTESRYEHHSSGRIGR